MVYVCNYLDKEIGCTWLSEVTEGINAVIGRVG